MDPTTQEQIEMAIGCTLNEAYAEFNTLFDTEDTQPMDAAALGMRIWTIRKVRLMIEAFTGARLDIERFLEAKNTASHRP